MLVFDNAQRNTKLYRTSRLALHAPTRVVLQDGEDFLLVRDDLAFEDPSVNLVDLSVRRNNQPLYFSSHTFLGSDRNPRGSRW